MESLSLAQARRVALAAQGFLDPKPAPSVGSSVGGRAGAGDRAGGATMRHLDRVIGRTGVLQIDSVNVFTRAHYMPLYSRLGPYDLDLLHRASGDSSVAAARRNGARSQTNRRLVEYWAHVASYMPVDLWPHMRWRMGRYYERGHEWSDMKHDPTYVAALLAEVAERGPSTARDLDASITGGLPRQKTHWGWNWSQTKRTLEYLFAAGELAVSGRNSQFERLYDLPSNVIPAEILAVPEPSPEEAQLELVRRATRSLGVGSLKSIADYYRLKTVEAKAALDMLVDTGEVRLVGVAGWRRPGYLHAEARIPRKVHARALLSPFDPVVWERERALDLFGFHYRIGIYTPAHQREHGYYALPFLLGDRPIARVDLKADRKQSALLVQGYYPEPDAPADAVEELRAELEVARGWLGLSEVRWVGLPGNPA